MTATTPGRTPASRVPTQAHIEPPAFLAAITALQRTWTELDGESEWQNVRVVEDPYGPPFLRIARRLDATVVGLSSCNGGSDSLEAVFPEDDDDEALERSPSAARPELIVLYDIVYSPSYRVPVLYLTHRSDPSADMHELLTPALYKPQLQSTGPLGALSLTDHPVTGLPAYFVHPCRTAEGMSAVGGTKSVAPVEYLLLWLGLVGPGVGLAVPIALAEALRR
ncbi:hypothetical protein LTR91_024171 [Friedmanniomyces endolithicus]|uniref:Ubiquitin-like-conjugating enzyme ATG10 n=1 Tax=Friedmanniomyces endolithicus TaxID=329885 RepID=A0AAN6K0Q4_9PEZI|nr:hypothetical protein LTR35_006712 [Friedmanniomyces endolithicus]KAK0297024.1 hypothetical protein LTS00_004303 [Friedmanniomyces endolithicus]KAK0314996.1 hypothetical protein LTR82_012777 [Friedmanniomyces endolithicus]KAK0928171.1 hypothetical protein LTR57_002905 [Friedmanniomyces endolithicus]KAK0952853.1 hypothetical protein LTR91_024171 [Friedmanniomyces endolithicus]